MSSVAFHLTTATGIPYKVYQGSPTFDGDEKVLSASETYIIQASRVRDFWIESFPPPRSVTFEGVGGSTLTKLLKPLNRPMPGNVWLRTKRLSVRPFTDDLPADPLSVDLAGQAAGSYQSYVLVQIDYEQRSAETYPYIDRAVHASGEIYTVADRNTFLSDVPIGTPIGPADPGARQDPDEKDPGIFKIVPSMELEFRAANVVDPDFPAILEYLAKTNDAASELFYDLEVETILFLGFSATQEILLDWVTGVVYRPWQVTLKFSVKRVVEGGETYGWNHVYSASKQKWLKVVRREEVATLSYEYKSLYESADYAALVEELLGPETPETT